MGWCSWLITIMYHIIDHPFVNLFKCLAYYFTLFKFALLQIIYDMIHDCVEYHKPMKAMDFMNILGLELIYNCLKFLRVSKHSPIGHYKLLKNHNNDRMKTFLFFSNKLSFLNMVQTLIRCSKYCYLVF